MKTHPKEFSLLPWSWKLRILNLGPPRCGHVPVDVFARRRTATIDRFHDV